MDPCDLDKNKQSNIAISVEPETDGVNSLDPNANMGVEPETDGVNNLDPNANMGVEPKKGGVNGLEPNVDVNVDGGRGSSLTTIHSSSSWDGTGTEDIHSPTNHGASQNLDMPHPKKKSLIKLLIPLICVGLLVAQFSANISDLHVTHRLLTLANSQENTHLSNVLQKGSAYCFVNNVTRVLSITCPFHDMTNIKSFSLGSGFDFDTCSFP